MEELSPDENQKVSETMGRKWANIVEKKTKLDANNSKIYAKFGIEIYVAAKQGEPDPHSNQKLKFVIDRAKTYNVPRHIIERGLEKLRWRRWRLPRTPLRRFRTKRLYDYRRCLNK